MSEVEKNANMMKAVYSDMFYDIRECNDTESEAVARLGKRLRQDLYSAIASIKDLKPLEAISSLEIMIKEY